MENAHHVDSNDFNELTDANDNRVTFYLKQILFSLYEFEAQYREAKLERSWWKKVTPILFNDIALKAFVAASTKLVADNDNCFAVEDESHTVTRDEQQRKDKMTTTTSSHAQLFSSNNNVQPDLNATEANAHQSLSFDLKAEDPLCHNDPALQYELEQRLEEAAQLQRALTPLLIRFWQTVPQQLRQKVKGNVVEALSVKIEELQVKQEAGEEQSDQCNEGMAQTSLRNFGKEGSCSEGILESLEQANDGNNNSRRFLRSELLAQYLDSASNDSLKWIDPPTYYCNSHSENYGGQNSDIIDDSERINLLLSGWLDNINSVRVVDVASNTDDNNSANRKSA